VFNPRPPNVSLSLIDRPRTWDDSGNVPVRYEVSAAESSGLNLAEHASTAP